MLYIDEHWRHVSRKKKINIFVYIRFRDAVYWHIIYTNSTKCIFVRKKKSYGDNGVFILLTICAILTRIDFDKSVLRVAGIKIVNRYLYVS